jgi:O-succinylbenzoate synthase
LPELDLACGLGTRALLRADVVAPPDSLLPSGGFLPVPRLPPAVDPDRLAEVRQLDTEREAWWLARLDRVGELLASAVR